MDLFLTLNIDVRFSVLALVDNEPGEFFKNPALLLIRCLAGGENGRACNMIKGNSRYVSIFRQS